MLDQSRLLTRISAMALAFLSLTLAFRSSEAWFVWFNIPERRELPLPGRDLLMVEQADQPSREFTQISSGRFVQEDKLNRLNLIGGAV